MSTSSDLRTALGPVGIWASFDSLPAPEVLGYARLVEELGFGTLWVNESVGREPFALLGALAGATTSITLGLGVATIYARDAVAAHAGARTIADLSGGRFAMGLGVSHRSSVAARGHDYAAPVTAMRTYLEAYDAASWAGPPVVEPPLVIAALGPRMLALAASRAAGAFPYLVDIGLVRSARRTLDEAAHATTSTDRPVLVVSQLAILGSGAAVREVARGAVGRYLGQPNYRNNLLRGGFSEAEIEAVADSLVDALVVTGDRAALAERVAEMHQAGADHVAVIPISVEGRPADVAAARALAPR